MPGFPKVTVLFSDDNLLRDITVIDSIAAIVGTVQTIGLIGIPKIVHNLKEAEDFGFTEVDEPDFHRHLKEFYADLAGNQELYIMGVADAMTMSQMLDKDEPDGAVKLLAASKGKVRLLGVFRKPDAGYDAGEDFFDADVEAALIKSKTFGEDQNARYNYLRCLVEGRINDIDSLEILDAKSVDTNYGGVVVGGSANDGSASIGTVLGRAVKFPAHIKIGKVANGPVQLTDVYFGAKKMEDFTGLEALHELGYISFLSHPTKAGVYIGIDRMANDGDYNLLAHGRIIDKAAIISVATYVEEIESEIDIVNGLIDESDLAHLEGRIAQELIIGMGDQVSKNGIEVYINASQNVIETETLKVRIRVRPKGYNTFITIDLGLTA